MKHLFLALTLLGTTSLFAGERAGNGGDAIVCGQKAYLLDYMEAKNRNIDIHFEQATTRTEMVEVAIKRLAKMDAERAKSYGVLAKEILDDIEILEDGPNQKTKFVAFSNYRLNDIDDSLESFSVPECEKVQLIIQAQPIFPHERLLTINKEVWLKMDATQQAMAVLHEVLYKEDIYTNHSGVINNYLNCMTSYVYQSINSGKITEARTICNMNLGAVELAKYRNSSTNSRYFNSLLSSPEFENFNHCSYRNFLNLISLPNYQYGPYFLGANSVKSCHEDGSPESIIGNYTVQNFYLSNVKLHKNSFIISEGTHDFSTKPENKNYCSQQSCFRLNSKQLSSTGSVIKMDKLQEDKGSSVFYGGGLFTQELDGTIVIKGAIKFQMRPARKRLFKDFDQIGTVDLYISKGSLKEL
ncbi:MAG: hypothetical protein ACOYL6_16065 [Bacteriovoracaceae bacterium]